MNVFQMRDLLKERLRNLDANFKFDREDESLRIERIDNQKGLSVKLAPIIAKYKSNGDKTIDEIVYYVTETINAMQDEATKEIKKIEILPVIRATSFHKETKEGVPFLIDEHTAETNIYYALDLGNTYRLIDESMIEELKLTKEQIKEQALFNIKKKKTTYKTDEVQGNTFYFVNTNDGYDASRILNQAFLKDVYQNIEGEMLIATPHQDVLVICDIKNEIGYDVIAQMTMHFFQNGLVPITSLSFSYEPDKSLEPIFILGKNHSRKRNQEVIERLEKNREIFKNMKSNQKKL
ncbi:DUF1444 domain-containing protein [Mammaliicoccus stepanovicii]|uniref:Putative cytosolic protein n=1 Tax=Mammaliicoccus stepanovicii TaxID=643214 RepID=A0A239Z0E9_9STAP|nr:DUF1444 domain-containing protein [Mammaliicoccus stepanovicii]PNZ79119.1 DUF1444 domain-containing protein [Mammaliicoccus stepanovicii]GGI40441.1 UPF0354 protein [Mammaliicoccus stepanovicii]SNV64116.1 Putative cytosolic protein [Mammaliicoccus stepanovicii]